MIDFIGIDAMESELTTLFNETLTDYGSFCASEDVDISKLPFTISESDFDKVVDTEVLSTNEDLISDYAYIIAQSINSDMEKYLHMSGHHIEGNFSNVEMDFEKEFGYGKFSDLIVELECIKDSEKADAYREWLRNWFFDAFGTFGLTYNFRDFLAETYYGYKYELKSAIEDSDMDWFDSNGFYDYLPDAESERA